MSDIQTWRAPLEYLVTLALAAHDTLHMRQGLQTCHNVTPHASEPIIFLGGFSALSFQMKDDYKLVEKKLNIHLDPDCSLVKHKSEPGHTSLKFLLREKILR